MPKSADPRLPADFPYPLQLGLHNKSVQYALAGIHLLLAINPTTILFLPVPVTGLVLATFLLIFAWWQRDAFTQSAVYDAFGRWLLAVMLVIAFAVVHLKFIQADTPFGRYTWFVLVLIQTPLSVYDAREVMHGRTVLKFHWKALFQ